MVFYEWQEAFHKHAHNNNASLTNVLDMYLDQYCTENNIWPNIPYSLEYPPTPHGWSAGRVH